MSEVVQKVLGYICLEMVGVNHAHSAQRNVRNALKSRCFVQSSRMVVCAQNIPRYLGVHDQRAMFGHTRSSLVTRKTGTRMRLKKNSKYFVASVCFITAKKQLPLFLFHVLSSLPSYTFCFIWLFDSKIFNIF